jgi:hypothetical protein
MRSVLFVAPFPSDDTDLSFLRATDSTSNAIVSLTLPSIRSLAESPRIADKILPPHVDADLKEEYLKKTPAMMFVPVHPTICQPSLILSPARREYPLNSEI